MPVVVARKLRFSASVALTIAAEVAGAQEPRDVPTFPSRTELVTVDAVVLDEQGRPARGLTAQDFALAEDGKSQEIVTFEAFDPGAGHEVAETCAALGPVATNVGSGRTGGSTFVLLVDDMSLAPSRQEGVTTALGRFLADGVRTGDELIFATTSGDAWWSAHMPEGSDDLLALFARVRGRGQSDNASDAVSEWEAFWISHFESANNPNASMIQRVVDRYYDRGVCQTLTPILECRSMVVARADQVDARRRNRTQDVLAAVDRAVFTLTGVRGRKALLLLTEGFLNDPDLRLIHEVAGRCREANIAVYSLDVRGLVTGLPGAETGGKPNTADLGAMQVEETEGQIAGSVGLADDTGGFALHNTNDLGAGALRIAEESRVYYLLGYAPREGKGPRDWRKLQVRVRRPGLTVRARKGYTLRTTAEIVAAADARLASERRPSAPRVPADVARALAGVRESDAIPLRAMAYVSEGRPSGALRTVIALEADMRSPANVGGEVHPRTAVTLSITVAHRDSGKVQRLDQRLEVEAAGARVDQAASAWDEGWLALSRDFDLAPGVNQARIVMRDELLGRMGVLTLRFIVPPAVGLRLSTPLLTNRVSVAKDGPARAIAVAHREFFGSNTLYCQFEVFGVTGHSGAGPTVQASYELRRPNGDVVRRTEPGLLSPSADGRIVRLVAMPLDGIPEGDHELVIRVEDMATGETRERIEPLRIARPATPLGFPTGAAGSLSTAFLKAVERYRRGDRDVVREKWSMERLRKDIANLKQLQQRSSTCGGCEERRYFESFPFEAAVMLHTDGDVEERNSHPALEEAPSLPAPLLEAARQMIELIPDPGRRRHFERPWLLAVALHLYQRGQWPMALRYIDLGLERYPEDPRFLLARGSILEAQGTKDLEIVSPAERAARTQSRREAAWQQVAASRGQMKEAEKCYRRALTADPGLFEARVRLGHVLHSLGQPQKAVPELEGVIAEPGADPHVRYLAWLFLGAIREAAGRPRDAVTAYQAAISVLPDSQAAYIALSHAHHRLGELAASREPLRGAIVGGGRRHDWDPWWVYPWGQSDEAEGRLEALRQQAVK